MLLKEVERRAITVFPNDDDYIGARSIQQSVGTADALLLFPNTEIEKRSAVIHFVMRWWLEPEVAPLRTPDAHCNANNIGNRATVHRQTTERERG